MIHESTSKNFAGLMPCTALLADDGFVAGLLEDSVCCFGQLLSSDIVLSI
jgi:hypothetical protein